MRKIKKGLTVFILLLLTTVFCISFAACGNDNTSDSRNGKSAAEIEESAPYGLYTDLQFIFKGENGYVSASVKNKFTLFPSTVTVNIELYRSDALEESVANMTLVASNYIYDLDQGETLTATASTEGRQSYWKARATYRIDNKAWKENLSETVFFNADGIKVTPPESLPDDKEYFISDFLQSNGKTIWVQYDITEVTGYVPKTIIIDGTEYPTHCGLSWAWIENDEEFKTVKDLFGEIKLNQFDIESKTLEQRQQFYFSCSTSSYAIYPNLNDGSNVEIYINDGLKEDWQANLFVRQSYKIGEKTIEKCFTASISAEAKQALIDFAEEIYQRKIDRK